MIHIEQNQTIPENENIRVLSQAGDYNDTDLIEYYSIKEPGIAQGAYHAQFIKYGGLVYRFSDPKELGEEILKIDPESTHTSASYVRMMNELLGKMNEGSLEPESLSQVISDEQANMEEKIEESFAPDKVEEEIIEEETFEEEPIIESVVEEETIPQMESPVEVEENILENVSTEIIPEEIVTPDILEPEIIPEAGNTSSLSEEIISYARNRISKKIKSKIIG